MKSLSFLFLLFTSLLLVSCSRDNYESSYARYTPTYTPNYEPFNFNPSVKPPDNKYCTQSFIDQYNSVNSVLKDLANDITEEKITLAKKNIESFKNRFSGIICIAGIKRNDSTTFLQESINADDVCKNWTKLIQEVEKILPKKQRIVD